MILKETLWQTYSNFCDKTGIKPVAPCLGDQLIRRVFPNVRTCNRKVDGKHTSALQKSAKRDFSIEEAQQMAPSNFILMSKNAYHIVFGIPTGDFINGVRVMKELTINNDGTWSVQVAGRGVKPEILGECRMRKLIYGHGLNS
jgi:hypothetical protein